jgi:hypothetical protein
MTAPAQNSGVWQFRNYGGGILSVPRQRAMACFASNSGVLSFGLNLGLLGMASFANLVSRELDGPGTDVVHGRRTEMPVFAEV